MRLLLVVLPGCDPENVMAMAERLRSGMCARGVSLPSGELSVTYSIGTSTSDPAGQTRSTSLIRAADEALYRAKREGRNRVEFAWAGEPHPAAIGPCPAAPLVFPAGANEAPGRMVLPAGR